MLLLLLLLLLRKTIDPLRTGFLRGGGVSWYFVDFVSVAAAKAISESTNGLRADLIGRASVKRFRLGDQVPNALEHAW